MIINFFRNTIQSKYNRSQFPALSITVFLSFLLMLFLTIPASANESPSTNPQQLTFEAGLDSNRTLGDRVMLWGQYQIAFNDNWQLHTGFSYNTATKLINALFIELGYQEINANTVGFRLKFLGNQYGEYGKAANSIIAYVNWDNSVYFIDFGVNYRFLNTNETQLWNIFYFDNTSTESTYYYSFRRRFVMNEGKYRLDLDFNNQDPMYAGNLGAYGFFLKNRITVNDKVAILGSVGFRQSGSIALSATYYKTMVFWGVEVVL